MKPKYIYFLLLLLCACRAELGIQPSEAFVKLYGGNGEQEGYDLLEVNAGFLLVGSTSSTGNGGTDIYLIGTDEEGNEMWNQTYGGTGNDVGKKLIHANGRTIVLGQETNSNGKTDIVLFSVNETNGARTDISTSLGWSHSDEQAADIITTNSEDGFIVVGSTTNVDLNKTPNSENDPQDVFITKVNNAGEIIWRRAYGNLQSNSNGNKGIDEGVAVIKWQDGYVILANTDFSAQNDQGSQNVRLIYINEDGRLLDSRVYGNNDIQAGRDLLAIEDSIYILGDNNGEAHYYIVNASFEQVNSQIIMGKESYREGHAMLESETGLFITGVGTTGFTNISGNPLFITHIGNDGFEQSGWPKAYGDRKESIGRSIIQVTGGSIAVCGTIYFGSNKMMCLVKTDQAGNLMQ